MVGTISPSGSMFSIQAKLIAGALLLSGVALADTKVTETPGPSILYRSDGTTQTFKTYAECLAAAPVSVAPGASSRCSTVMNILKVGACEGTEPALPAE